jgi:excisionase family DNA binding protein
MQRKGDVRGGAAVADDRLLRKKEAASMLACSSRTIDRLVSLGRLRRVKVLGGVRFRLSEIFGMIAGGAA